MNKLHQEGKVSQEQARQLNDAPLEKIPEEWELVTVNDIATITTGGKDTQDRDDAAEYPFFVRSQTVERIGTYSFDGEAVLTAGDGVGVGKVVHYYVGKFDFHQRVYCMHSFTDDMNGSFFYQYFRLNFMSRITQFSAKGSVDSVRMDMISKMLIPKPPKPEQTKIAEILSTVDRVIEQTEALIAKQQRIKTGLMQDLLTRGIDENGNLRSEQTHQFKDSPLGRIPVEWEARELRTYLSYLSYGFTNPMPEAKDGPYMVTAANVANGVVEYDYCRCTTVEAYDKLLTKKSRPEIGDILITKDGTLGRLAVVDRLPLCINQSVAVMRPKEDVDNIYLKLLLESPEYQKRILDDSGGSTIKHIYISKIDKMVIGVPREKVEQKAIKKLLLSQYGLLDQYNGNLKKLKSLKTALMQDLLTGKKRVTALLNNREVIPV